jgi:hypothetical protein
VKIRHRYRRLTLWNKVAFWGSACSIVALAIVFLQCLFTRPSSEIRLSDAETWYRKVDEYDAADAEIKKWETANNLSRCGAPAQSISDLADALDAGAVPQQVRALYRLRQRKFEALIEYASKSPDFKHKLEEDPTLAPKPPRLPAGKLPEIAGLTFDDLRCYLGAFGGPCRRIFSGGHLVLPRGLFTPALPHDLMLTFSAADSPHGVLLDLLSSISDREHLLAIRRNRWFVPPHGLKWANDTERLEVASLDGVPLVQVWFNSRDRFIYIGGRLYDKERGVFEATPGILRSENLFLAFVSVRPDGWSAKIAASGHADPAGGLMRLPPFVLGEEWAPRLRSWFKYEDCPTLVDDALRPVLQVHQLLTE